ncbi:proline--tRNA ligase [Candidatus Microgenomates bacterium]|nr:proline--tRNA ligase [Candidatus Microgenomates bacterium]
MGDFTKLTSKTKNISKWYLEVIDRAKLADYGPAKGTMIIRPYGYAIWENVVSAMDKEIKSSGAVNAYFPMFIPNSLFSKEKDHVAGFAPETAVVTHGGGEELADPLVVRPTSEMIMYDAYSRWISSWRDLPLVINQWNNIVRWEKRTYPFLRTSEFLWQEGHGAHATKKDNWERVIWGIKMYEKIYKEFFALDGLIGTKSESEKFAGAQETLPYEILVEGGKVIQSCTSHDLGQNFSKALGISFQDKNGKTEYVWQNSWGFSTRSIGALVMSHGDDKGLVLPPKLAPVKVVIIPILGKKDTEILKYCEKIKGNIEKLDSEFPGGVEISSDNEKSFGHRISESELRGIPIKITVGTRELQENTVSIGFRLDGMKPTIARVSELSEKTEEYLVDIQERMFINSEEFLKENTFEVNDFEKFKKIMKTTKGLIKAYWCEEKDCEEKIKEETKATTRLKKLDVKKESGEKCIYCNKVAHYLWYFAQAY